MQSSNGAIIATLSQDGPAAVAGLHVGDVVLRFGARTPKDVRELQRFIAAATVDQTVSVTVLRDGQERIFPVTIKQWPRGMQEIKVHSTQAAAPAVSIPADLGLRLTAITDELRARYGLDAAKVGVVINGISAGTDAAARGLSPGDLIMYVQAEQVQTPQQVQAAIDAARARHRPYVAALVLKTAQNTSDPVSSDPVWIALRVTPP